MTKAAGLQIVISVLDESAAGFRAVLGRVQGLGDATARVGVTLAKTFAIGATAAGAMAGAVGTFGLSMNNQMEQVSAQLMAFTKDGAKTAEILDMIRERAAKTPFSFEQMATAAAGLMPAAKAAGESLEGLIETAEILAASNPAQGLEGAAFALREAVSGDFVSLMERFNLPRTMINQLKEEGLPNLEIVRRAMLGVGYDADLVSNLAQTATGRWSTFKDTLQGLAATITQPIFDRLSGGLGGVNDWLERMKPRLEEVAVRIGDWLAENADKAATALGKIIPVIADTVRTLAPVVRSMLAYGTSMAENLAIGLIQGAGYIVTALTGIGEIIASWLKPGSPPKLLPDLDQWGQKAAEVYLQGWALADTTPLTALATAIRDRLGAAIQSTVTAHNDLTAAQERLRAESERMRGILNPLQIGMRDLDEQLRRLAISQEQAMRPLLAGLEEIDQRLRDARDAFAEQLAPLDAELQAIRDRRDEIERQTRLKEIDKQLADETLDASQRELLALERRRIELEASRDARVREFEQAQAGVEAERQAAQDRITDLRKQQDTQRQTLQDQRTAIELQIMDAERLRDATIKPLEDQVVLAQQKLDIAEAEVVAAREAADAVADQFKTVEEKAATAGAGIGAALRTGIEAAIAGTAGGGESLGDRIADRYAENLGETVAAPVEGALARIKAELDKLVGKLDGLRATWNGVFDSMKAKVDDDGGKIASWIGGIGAALGTWVILGAIATGLRTVIGAWGALQTALVAGKGLGAVVAMLGGPVTLAIAAVTAAVGLLFVAWRENWGGIQEKTEAVRAFIVETALPALRDAFDTAMLRIRTALQPVFDFIDLHVLPVVQEWYRVWVEEVMPQLPTALTNAWIAIETIFKELDRWLRDNIIPIVDALRVKWNEATTWLRDKWVAMWDAIRPHVETLFNWLGIKLPEGAGLLQTAWALAWDAVKNKITEVYDRYIKPVFDAIERFWSWLTGADFNLNFNLPDLPEWARPGSPLPLHTAWREFADWLRATRFDWPTAAPGVASSGSGLFGAGADAGTWAGPPVWGGAGGPGGNVQNVVISVESGETDADRESRIEAVIRRVLREYGNDVYAWRQV